jgi:hypothetical protein
MSDIWKLYAPAILPPWNNPGTHWIRDCVDPRADINVLYKGKIACTCWDSNPGSSNPYRYNILIYVVKVKVTPWHAYAGGGNAAVLFRPIHNPALGGGWSAPRSGLFTPGKDPVPAGWEGLGASLDVYIYIYIYIINRRNTKSRRGNN